MEYIIMDGRIILKLILLKKKGKRMYSGFNWLITGSNGGLL
jgi:hypothetical protein